MKRKFLVTTKVWDVKDSAVSTMIFAESLGDALSIADKQCIQDSPGKFISEIKDVTTETSANHSDVYSALVNYADIRPAAIRAIMEILSESGYFDFEEIDFAEREYINGICVFWPLTGEVDFDYVKFSSTPEQCNKKADEIAESYWERSGYVIHHSWEASCGEERIRKMFEEHVAQEIHENFGI